MAFSFIFIIPSTVPTTITEKYLIAHGVPTYFFSTYFTLRAINLDEILLYT